MIDLRQSLNYVKFMQVNGWLVEKIPQQVFIRKIPLLGSIIKIQRPQGKVNFQKIDQIAKKYKALFVKFELPQQLNNEIPTESRGSPTESRYSRLVESHRTSTRSVGTMKQLGNNGFRQDKWPLLPSKTIHLDLTKSEKQLLKAMAKDTRYSLRHAKNSNLTIGQLNNGTIKTFYQSFQKYGRGYIPNQKEFQSLVNFFDKDALLLIAKRKNEIFAGAIFLIADKTAYYFYAFTSPKGRKNFTQYAIVWQAIKELKKRGIKILDLEGIYDSRFKFTRKWCGFSHFKKSFGGKEVEFPGSFTKYYHPLLKILHFLFRKFRK